MSRVSTGSLVLAFGLYAFAFAQDTGIPRIWDDAALDDWTTPVAGLNVRPAHYQSTGWNPPGVEKRAIKGHVFGLSLPPAEKEALLAFLRSL
jgi:hypothetical protein